MTQIEQVRRHLESGKSITPATALAVYGIFRLAVAIEHLRWRGMTIDTIIKYDEMGKKYAEYRLPWTIRPGDIVQVRPGYGVGLPSWVRKSRPGRVKYREADSVGVEFSRGKKHGVFVLNVRELVNAN